MVELGRPLKEEIEFVLCILYWYLSNIGTSEKIKRGQFPYWSVTFAFFHRNLFTEFLVTEENTREMFLQNTWDFFIDVGSGQHVVYILLRYLCEFTCHLPL
jgi:hypothetical protein